MSNESICIINAESGIGTASPQISQFSHNCSAIEFIINRDLSDFAVVVITSAEGKVSAVSEGEFLTKAYNAQTDETTLVWHPQKEITSQSGCVIYQIAAYSTGDDDKVIWYSKEGRLIVNDSIDTTDLSTELIGSSPNLVMQILTLAKGLELITQQSSADILENEQRISNNEENIKANSDKISNVTRELDSYKSQIHKGESIYDKDSESAMSGIAVAQAIAAIVDSAPDTLNTLEELAAALGDDPNFATTIMTLLGGKVDKVDGKGLSANDYTDADKAMVTNADSMVMEHAEEIRVMNDTLAQFDIDTGLLSDEIESHIADRSNPHFVTKKQIGLENVDNTSDMDKPVSRAMQESLDGKVTKEAGKGLSSNDFTDADKQDIVNIRSDLAVSNNDINKRIYALSERVTTAENDITRINADIERLTTVPIITVPATLETNQKYNFGTVEELSLVFPNVAADGDVIYITFKSGEVPTTLSIDTTNTCDIELIPEADTYYEVFGSFNGSIWLVDYNDYTVSEVTV